MVGPSRLALQADYYMFKDGIRPSYEENPTGGVWTFNLEKGNKKRLEESWLHLVRACVRGAESNSVVHTWAGADSDLQLTHLLIDPVCMYVC